MANEEGKQPSPSRAEALRAAVDQAVGSAVDQAVASTTGRARGTRERAQEVADDLAAAAGRVRDMLDDLRPPSADEVRTLHQRLDELEARIAKLERHGR
jgi:polyhydroxyalkanoate synthesis regulator phasin